MMHCSSSLSTMTPACLNDDFLLLNVFYKQPNMTALKIQNDVYGKTSVINSLLCCNIYNCYIV